MDDTRPNPGAGLLDGPDNYLAIYIASRVGAAGTGVALFAVEAIDETVTAEVRRMAIAGAPVFAIGGAVVATLVTVFLGASSYVVSAERAVCAVGVAPVVSTRVAGST